MSVEKARAIRSRAVITLYVVGIILIAVALSAEALGVDKTPGFGMIQMVLFLFGLSTTTLAIFTHMKVSKRGEVTRSLQADIGVRLAATGLVFAFVAGLSDLIGIGTHVNPNFERPFVGPLQLGGLGLGIVSIAAGILLYLTSRSSGRRSSSLNFLGSGGKSDREQ